MVLRIGFGSREYLAAVELRRQVLRIPLGLNFSEEDLAAESSDAHFAFIRESSVVGCLIMTPLADAQVQMRQVAVDFALQGTGIGSAMVAASETWSGSSGFSKIVVHARAEAVPFYTRLGYSVVGEPFVEVGIPHRMMEKALGV